MKYFITIVLLFMLFILSIRYYPIKIAVDEHNLSQSTNEYVICKAAYTTGFEWLTEKSSNSYSGYIFIEGIMKNPQVYIKYDVLPYNKFIFYGKFKTERSFDGKTYPVFFAESWDIVAPINRDAGIPSIFSPSYGLTWIDFYH